MKDGLQDCYYLTWLLYVVRSFWTSQQRIEERIWPKGSALSPEDERKLLETIGQSSSAALYPFFILTLDAGLRPTETRALRRRDLHLAWCEGSIAEGEIIVGRSKTEAGSGRMIPLTRCATAALTIWLSRFADAGPDAFVFPFHYLGFAGNVCKPHLWAVDHARPMSSYSYKTAFNTARRKAGGWVIGSTTHAIPSSPDWRKIRR